MDFNPEHQVIFARNWTHHDQLGPHDITFYGWISSDVSREIFEKLTNFLLFNLDSELKSQLVEIVDFISRVELSENSLNYTNFGIKIGAVGFRLLSAHLNPDVVAPPSGRRSEINIIFSVSEIKNDDESDNSQDDSSHDFDSLDFYEAETLEYDRSQNEKLRDFYDGF